MTTFNYARTRATASKLITRFGADAIIRKQGVGNGPAHDPGEGQIIDLACKAAVIEYSNRDRVGTLIEETDRKALVQVTSATIETLEGPLTFWDDVLMWHDDVVSWHEHLITTVLDVVPATQDRFVWQGEELTIVHVKPTAPAGVVVMYELQVRA